VERLLVLGEERAVAWHDQHKRLWTMHFDVRSNRIMP
jgi:hypothetical protein